MSAIVESAVKFEPLKLQLPPGCSLWDIARAGQIPEEHYDKVGFLVNGAVCEDWDYVCIEGDNVNIAVYPEGGGGGKKIFSTIAMIAIAVAAPHMAAGMLGKTVATMGITGNLLAAGITMVGSLLLSALIPPPSFNTPRAQAKESQTHGLSPPTNTAVPYGVIPCLYGTWRMAPNLCTIPNQHAVGKTTRISACYDFGYGFVDLDDIKVGDQPISNIIDSETQLMGVRKNTLGDDLEFIDNQVAYDQLNYTLLQNQDVLVTAKPNSDHAIIDVSFPRGLVYFLKSDGSRQNQSINFNMFYRVVGTTNWRSIPSSSVSGAKSVVTTKVWNAQTYARQSMAVQIYRAFVDKREMWIRVFVNGRRIYAFRSNDAAYTNSYKTINANGTNVRIVPGIVETYRDRVESGNTYTMEGYSLQLEGVAAAGYAITDSTAQPFTLSIDVPNLNPNNQYEFKITRTSAVPTVDNRFADATVSLIRSFKHEPPLNLKKRHTLLELSFISTDKINGAIQNLSALATRRLRDISNTGFINGQYASVRLCSNPAIIAVDILMGEATGRPLNSNQINWTEFKRLRDICNQNITTKVNGRDITGPRYTFNGIVDNEVTVKEIVNAVLSNARAQLIIDTTGKYSVLHDEIRTPRQMFTPTNYSEFSGSMAYFEKPHALKVTMIQAPRYTPYEFYVYNDGYNANNTTMVEELRTYGLAGGDTAFAEAVRYGRYMMAQANFRAETFTMKVQAENLVIQRGDTVKVSSDVSRTGGVSAKVIEITNGGLNLRLDRPINVPTDPQIHLRRNSDGALISRDIVTQVSQDTIVISAALNANTWQDALCVIGTRDYVTEEYIVIKIEPTEDLSAVLELQPYDSRVYQVDNGPIPDWAPDISDDASKTNLAVTNVGSTYSVTYEDRKPFGYLNLTWGLSGNVGTYNHAQVLMTVNGVTTVLGETTGRGFFHRFDLLQPEIGRATFTIKPVDGLGLEGKAGTHTRNITNDKAQPKPVYGFEVDVVYNTSVELRWVKTDEPMVVSYDVRYSDNLINPAWSNAQKLATVGWETNRVTAGARTGSYGIQAVSISGNRSTPVWSRTTVSRLPDLDIIKTLNDWPSFNGTKGPGITIAAKTYMKDWIPLNDALAAPIGKSGAGLEITGGSSWYIFETPFDLGSIEVVRLQNKIQAFAYDQSGLIVSDGWDAWIEYSTSADGSTSWTPYRRFESVDAQARWLRFKLVMETSDPTTTIKSLGTKVEVDVQERVEHHSNQQIKAVGNTRITFNFGYRDIPTVAITIDGNTANVAHDIVSKTKQYIDLRLVNRTTKAQVAGQVDVSAIGWGKQVANII